MKKFIGYILYRVLIITYACALVIGTALFSLIVYIECFSDLARDKKLHTIYNKLWAVTGQAQMRIPLIISENPSENAYNYGFKIFLFRGLINSSTDEELTLVLGHEIAHGVLDHFHYGEDTPLGVLQGLEGNADKMGALYALKIGADVCAGRGIFKRWKEQIGNPPWL